MRPLICQAAIRHVAASFCPVYYIGLFSGMTKYYHYLKGGLVHIRLPIRMPRPNKAAFNEKLLTMHERHSV